LTAGVRVYGHTGVVGAQLYRWLAEAGTAGLSGVSLDRVDGDSDSVPEWAFVCVPTPTTDEGQDLSAVEDVLARLAGHPCAVVIRSTVLPGTCDRIQAEYPEWDVYHWPEFLSAATAWEDFCHPDVQVLGYASTQAWQRWSVRWDGEDDACWLPGCLSRRAYCRLAEAETVKYAHNVHGALQVTLANLVYDACEQSMARWSGVSAVLTNLPNVGQHIIDTYWDVGKDGKRGFGGACFPKDVKALRLWLGDKAELLEGMERANARLRAMSALM
jgi:UDPglucose 6-dehydrogenase